MSVGGDGNQDSDLDNRDFNISQCDQGFLSEESNESSSVDEYDLCVKHDQVMDAEHASDKTQAEGSDLRVTRDWIEWQQAASSEYCDEEPQTEANEERTHQTLIGMVKTMMHQSRFPKSFWTNAFETAVYVKNRVYCKGAGRTPYEMIFRTKPDIHHIRALGSLAFCHVPKSKRKKLMMDCRMGFLIGYREDVVSCHIYFPTEHKTGFVLDVKINEAIKYCDRYDSGYKRRVNTWLQTFHEFIQEDDINEFADEDNDDNFTIYPDAEIDVGSRNASSNVDMELVLSDVMDSPDIWGGRLCSRMTTIPSAIDTVQQGTEPSETSENGILWDDILRNSSLPTFNDAFEETQEGEITGSSSEPDGKLSSSSSAQDNESNNGHCSIGNQLRSGDDDSRGDDDNETLYDESQEDGDTDEEIVADDDFTESVGHVTDMSAVMGTEASLSELANYDHLFDPSDQLEAENDDEVSGLVGATQNALTIMPEQIIGHTHPRDIEIKRVRDRKRTKGNTKKARANLGLYELEYFDDFVVGSSFRALHVDIRGDEGINARNVKIPRTH